MRITNPLSPAIRKLGLAASRARTYCGVLWYCGNNGGGGGNGGGRTRCYCVDLHGSPYSHTTVTAVTVDCIYVRKNREGDTMT